MKRYLIAILLLTACGRDEAASSDKPDASEPVSVASDDNRGPQGEKGDKGDPGNVANSLMPNEWIDPGTGLKWSKGSQGLWADLNRCAGVFEAPSQAQLLEAIYHGLFGVFPSAGAWTKDEYAPDTSQGMRIYISGGLPVANVGSKTALAQDLFCKQK